MTLAQMSFAQVSQNPLCHSAGTPGCYPGVTPLHCDTPWLHHNQRLMLADPLVFGFKRWTNSGYTFHWLLTGAFGCHFYPEIYRVVSPGSAMEAGFSGHDLPRLRQSVMLLGDVSSVRWTAHRNRSGRFDLPINGFCSCVSGLLKKW